MNTRKRIHVIAIWAAMALGVAGAVAATITTLTNLPDVGPIITPLDRANINANAAAVNASLSSVNTQLGTLVAGTVTALTSAPLPAVAAGVDIGSTLLPFGNFWVGQAATNNVKLTANTTGARVATFPDATITVSGAVAQYCGTTTTCAHTSIGSTLKIVTGSAALASGSPSIAAVTGMSPAFTAAGDYSCTAQDTADQTVPIGVLSAGYVSGSAVTFTGPNTVTDVIRYICIGF